MGEKKNKKLGEICHIVSGGTPSRSNIEYWDNGNIPWIKIGDIKGKYINSASEFITRVGLDNSSAKLLKKGTILYTIFATLGEVGILNFDACTNQAIAGITIKEDINVLPDYLYYYLKSIKNRINKLGRGVAQNNINLSILKNLDIAVIEVNQQKEIIKTLDCVDSIIRLHKKELELLDTLIKARFVEMFGDPVLNSFGWCRVSLSEVTSKIGSGATPKGGKESYRSEGISLIRSMNVHDGKFKYKDLAHITEKQAKQLNNVIVEENDVLVNITGASIARTCVVPKNVLPARVNQHVAIIRCDCEQVQPVFLNNLFLNIRFKKMLLSMGENGGATRQAITKQQLENMDVIVPPLSLQNEFAAFVQQIDKLRFGGRKRLTKAKNTKNNNRNTITLERSTLYGK